VDASRPSICRDAIVRSGYETKVGVGRCSIIDIGRGYQRSNLGKYGDGGIKLNDFIPFFVPHLMLMRFRQNISGDGKADDWRYPLVLFAIRYLCGINRHIFDVRHASVTFILGLYKLLIFKY